MIVGVDVSSRRVDLAWLEDGRPQRWHQELGGPKTHLIDRLRSIHVQWPDVWSYPENALTDIAIEMPFGQSRKSVGALMATVGVVTKQAPYWARVAWPSSGELRGAIGCARNTKLDAMLRIHELYPETWDTAHPYDEHERDALVACLGWTRILEAQE